ncbi:retention module-containing protein, partial [uncultured Neptuniibacter sp.]|uniref:retention module-containing protein n=1 Tax=uncultured Neptuniibacter sp. TaxID=502143 RepID=UPI0026305566
MSVIGSVSQITGKVVAIKPDGSERVLSLGDPVFDDDLIKVAQDATIEISMNDAGPVSLEGGQTWLVSSETYNTAESLDVSEARAGEESINAAIAEANAEAAAERAAQAQQNAESEAAAEALANAESQANTDAAAEADAIQAAILAGADPTEVGEATAAGGETGAGGNQGNEGTSTVNIARTAGEVDPNAGYETIGIQDSFEQPEQEDLGVVLPTVSVSVNVNVDTPTDPTDPEVPDTPTEEFPVLVEGNSVSILEGSDVSGGADSPTLREIKFELVLDKVFGSDVTVTYQLVAGSAEYGVDWLNGDDPEQIYTVVIPAGETAIPVSIFVIEDKLDEGNETVDIVLLSADNATIGPDSSGMLTIFDDDTTPVANADTNWLVSEGQLADEESQEQAMPYAEGNILQSIAHDGDPSDEIDFADQADSDADGDPLSILTVSSPVNGVTDITPDADGETIQGQYGTLTIYDDGSYRYEFNPESVELTFGQTVEDEFGYSVTDGYNTPQDSTLTITIFSGDSGVEILDLTPTLEGGDVIVDEDDLPQGSDGSQSNTQQGTFTISAPDGVDTVSVGGVTLIAAGALVADPSFSTALGNTFTVTNYDANSGVITYEYTLEDAETHANADGENSLFEELAVVLRDTDGDEANDILSVQIVDDLPGANDDGPVGVTEDAASFIDGDVLLNDDANADQSAVFVGWSADGQDNAAAIAALDSYGTLVQGGDGTWSFTLDNSLATTQALTTSDNLSYDLWYTMADADGDESAAKLTITITGSDDSASVATGEGETVYEAGLPAGSANDESDLVVGGTFTVSASDGIETVTIGGTDFTLAEVEAFDGSQTVNTGQGVLTLMSYAAGTITYNYALSATIDNDSATPISPEAVDGDSYLDVVTIEVDGIGGSYATDDLEITIIDDTPTAVDDGPVGVTEDATSFIDGDVLLNDDANADQSSVFVGWSADGQDNAAAIAALDSYGTLVQGGDGTWSFTLDNSLATTQALTTSDNLSHDLWYTMADADGDESAAKLTITITGSDDSASVATGEGETVYEAGLPTGSANDDSDLVVGGTFTVSASDGIETVTIGGTDFTLAEVEAFDGSQTVNTGQGVLTLMNYAAGTITYNYALSATIDNDSATPISPETVDGDSYLDVVTIEVDGIGGSYATDDLEITIIDDTPTAVNDGPVGVTEDATSFIDGDVLLNDDANADQSSVFVGWAADGQDNTGSIAELAKYGSLSLNANGTWDYTLDNSLPATQALTAGDNLFYDLYYTMADADGDEAIAKLTINVIGANDGSSVDAGDGETVYEAGLPAGSANDDSDLIQSGTFDVAATDGIATITIGTTVLTYAELADADGTATYQINTGQGLLTLTDYVGDAMGGTVTYDYALAGAIDNDSATPTSPETVDPTSYLDVVSITVDGAGGSTGSDDLEITIIDDAPTANDDARNIYEGTSAIAGNALGILGSASGDQADIKGADGATVTAFRTGTEASVSGTSGVVDGSTKLMGSYGELTLDSAGIYVYHLDQSMVDSLAEDQTVQDVFTYTITDGDGDTDQAEITITVTGVNDQPVVSADTNWAQEDLATIATGNVLDTLAHDGAPDGASRGDVEDTDVDTNDILTVTNIADGDENKAVAANTTSADGTVVTGLYGTLTIGADGSYSYILNDAAIQGMDDL